MKILVTGGAGYVGNVLIRLLLDLGYEVRCVDNFHKGSGDALIPLVPNHKFEFMYGDVSNEDHVKRMVKDVDGIVNLAGIVGFPACARQPALSTAVNVTATELLLKHRNKETPFVYASTGSVYGKIEGVCTEDSPLNAVSKYGLDKAMAEEMVRKEPNTVSFRFATGFGVSPNMRINLLVNDLVYQAINNRCMTIFEADARRTFIHVEDMAHAFLLGLTSYDKLKYNVYNAGANNLNWSKRTLAEYICNKTGALVNYAEIGKDLDQRDYEVSYDRLDNEGFQCKVTMEEGIEELIRVTPILQVTHRYM